VTPSLPISWKARRMISMNITPSEIDDNVKRLVNMICPGSKPIYLPVEPESYAEVCECFPAIKEKISRDGGSQEFGWQIWKTDFLMEAEFHAVWKSPGGELKDITPKQMPVHKILFLLDPKVKYEGAQVDNIRINISGNQLVDDYIEISKAKFRLGNKGQRAFQHKIELTEDETKIHEELRQLDVAISFMILQRKGRNSLCFCGSGNKYKHCHGKYLPKFLNRI
jgi:hypothetical protein